MEWEGTAAMFFTTYEMMKATLPAVFVDLRKEELAPVLHMLAASGGEVVRFSSSLPRLLVREC